MPAKKSRKPKSELQPIVPPELIRTRGELAPIQLRGVRVHNLKNIDVDIPRGKLVAICGVSGSGKTSLALDTLYAEGQRRYIESFSPYTRQFLQRLDKPDYDSINHLPPALAVTRTGTARGNRSTVGTASETLDYLRLLFSKVATLHCIQCGQLVTSQDPQAVARLVAELPPVKVIIGFETHWEDAVDRASVLADLQAMGFVRLVASGQTLNIGSTAREELGASLPVNGRVLVIADRIKGGDTSQRLAESLESAFQHGAGEAILLIESNDAVLTNVDSANIATARQTVDGQSWLEARFSKQLRCPVCRIDYPSPESRLFNFNSPLGACPTCEGFGDTVDLDRQLIVPDDRKSLRAGAIAPWNSPSYQPFLDELLDIADALEVPVDVPFHRLTEKQVGRVFEGDATVGYQGLAGFFAYLERKKYKMHVRVFLSRWRSYSQCATCHGRRLNPHALAYSVSGQNFAQLCELQVDQLAEMLAALLLGERQLQIAANVLSQTLLRLNCLQQVGLGYLALARTLRTLSGGEAQRTALTTALGSSLVHMLYVLDEPSVGLHPQDVERLASAITSLADRGNTVVIVEHEPMLLNRADHIIEVGPKAGEHGGEVVFTGTVEQVCKSPTSLTGAYLSGRKEIAVPSLRRQADRGSIDLKGCRGNNLQNINVGFPLGLLCLVTGVSGSGKSSLVQDTLAAALLTRLTKLKIAGLPFDELAGVDQVEDCIVIDQSPVSRSPRSNPVTYVKAFDEIRQAFAETLDAKTRNFSAGHFSFNSELGRCPTCSGDGLLQIDMQFLADVTMTCSSCNGNRYRPEILAVRYRDRSIADVLRMTISEASAFFRGSPKVQQKLKVLTAVGLDYVQLGQSAMTLSSGEAQRLKLAAHLSAASKRRTLFLLDEPTTGLHTHDIATLLRCFNALLEAGHSLIVVEHNLSLIAAADYIIDLGPGPAAQGGRIVAQGTPEQVAACPESMTGRHLKMHFS